MLYPPSQSLAIAQVLPSPHIPNVNHPLLVAARKVVPVRTPLDTVHFTLVHLYPIAQVGISPVVELDGAAAHADRKHAVSPVHPAYGFPTLVSPVLDHLFRFPAPNLYAPECRSYSYVSRRVR